MGKLDESRQLLESGSFGDMGGLLEVYWLLSLRKLSESGEFEQCCEELDSMNPICRLRLCLLCLLLELRRCYDLSETLDRLLLLESGELRSILGPAELIKVHWLLESEQLDRL